MGVCSSNKQDRSKEEKEEVAVTHRVETKNSTAKVSEEKDLKIDNKMLVKTNKSSFLNSYSITRELGKGTYSSVYLVTHKYTKMQRAMKKIKKRINLVNDCDDIIRNEVDILVTLDHPNIVKI